MTVRKADTMTSEAVPAVHAGVNTMVSTYTLEETLTAAQTIAIAVLPGGARVTDVLVVNGLAAIGGSAQYTIAVQGRSLMLSAEGAAVTRANGVGLGVRLTSDATAELSITQVAGGQMSVGTFRVITSYLADKDKD